MAVPLWSTLNLHPIPTSSTGAKRRPPGRCPHLPPTSLRRLFLSPVPHACVCFCSCSGVLPPLPPLACTQVPVGPWGVFLSRVPPCLYVFASSFLSFFPNIGIVLFWCPCWVVFREKLRDQGASTPWHLHALVLAPRYLAMPAPFRLPHPPPPTLPLSFHSFLSCTIHVGRSSVRIITKSWCNPRIYQSW